MVARPVERALRGAVLRQLEEPLRLWLRHPRGKRALEAGRAERARRIRGDPLLAVQVAEQRADRGQSYNFV